MLFRSEASVRLSVIAVGAASSSVRLNVSEVTVTPRQGAADRDRLVGLVHVVVGGRQHERGRPRRRPSRDRDVEVRHRREVHRSRRRRCPPRSQPPSWPSPNLVELVTVAVTVTVFAPPFSATVVRSTMLFRSEASVRLSVIAVGAASSSVRLNVSASLTVTPDKAPLTVTVSLVLVHHIVGRRQRERRRPRRRPSRDRDVEVRHRREIHRRRRATALHAHNHRLGRAEPSCR